MNEILLVEEQKKFVPEFKAFRDYVDRCVNARLWEKKQEIAIKLLYLIGARVSEIITKVSPKQLELGMTKPYGQLLRWELVNYKMRNGEMAKILLVHSAIAKASKNQKPQTSPEAVEAALSPKQVFRVPMRETPIIVTPSNMEPWGADLLFWIRDKGTEAQKKGADNRKAVEEALRFPITEMTLQNWVFHCLKGLAPHAEPQYFGKLNRLRKPIHPHSLRSWRLTHLKTAYSFNPIEQCSFVRWSVRSQEAKRGINVSSNVDIYSALSWTDYIDKLCKPISEIL